MKRIYLFTSFLSCLYISVISQEIAFKVVSAQYPNGVIKWDISADNENTNFKDIKKVVYNLDGLLFSEPIRETGNNENNFLLTLFGSSESDADAEVYYKNGSITKTKIKLTVTDKTNLKLKNTAREIKEGYWEWEAFISGPPSELMNIDHVDYQMHSSFRNPYRQIKQMGNSNKSFVLKAKGWGVFNLNAKVYFKDGKSISLQHVLQFNKIKVDVFYLASTAATTKPIAETIARVIETDNRFITRVREISDKKNAEPGYKIENNQMRYEILEEDYANDILEMLKKENSATSIEKSLIKFNTTEYISIFIVK